MNYSVIVVTFNRLDLLKICLEQISRQTLPFAHTVVVDNCSTDGTAAFLEEYTQNRPDILSLKTEENIGGAGGFAFGAARVPEDSDYVLFIDDDAILDEHFLEEIDKEIEPDVKAYTGSVYTDGQIHTSHRRKLTNRTLLTMQEVPAAEYAAPFFMCDIGSFCGMLVAYDLIRQIGLPAAEYFSQLDDVEYSMRVLPYSRIKNVNAAVIDHRANINAPQKLNWRAFYSYRNWIDVGEKYSSHPAVFLLYRRLFHVLGSLYYRFLGMVRHDAYYTACARLHKNAWRDGIQHKYGISQTYRPGAPLP